MGKINGCTGTCLKIDMKIDYPIFLRFSCIVKLCVAFAWPLCGLHDILGIFKGFKISNILNICSKMEKGLENYFPFETMNL